MLPETPHVALREELRLTSELIRKYLGRECVGLRTPFGYYRGLRDRPDLLEIVARHGPPLRHLVGAQRAERQPHAVGRSRSPTPRRASPTCSRSRSSSGSTGSGSTSNGYGEGRAFRRALEGAVDEIAEQDLVFATAFHEWVAVEADEEGTGWIRGLIERARERGVEVTSYADYAATLPGASRRARRTPGNERH